MQPVLEDSVQEEAARMLTKGRKNDYF